MGGRMAATLARAGHALAVHDVDPAKAGALAAAGAAACASAREVAQQSDIVFSSLPLPATVRSVYLGPDGVLEGARPGMVLVDTSTVDPETSRAVSAAAAARGVQYLDAPVSGGFREAETGALVIIVGGDRDGVRPGPGRAGRAGPERSLRGALRGGQRREAGQQRHVDGQRAGRRRGLRARRQGGDGARAAASRSSARAPAGRSTSSGGSPTSWPGTSRRASRWTWPARISAWPWTWRAATTSRCRRRACCTSSTTPAPRWERARATSRPSSRCSSRGRAPRCAAPDPRHSLRLTGSRLWSPSAVPSASPGR